MAMGRQRLAALGPAEVESFVDGGRTLLLMGRPYT
jgi:hypothetical protein